MSDGKPKLPERKHPRIETSLEVPYWKYVKVRVKEEAQIGFVKNLSFGGFFVESENLFEVGTEIGFEFFVPSSAKAISGQAVVRWVRNRLSDPLGGYLTSGMGLEFLKFDGDTQEDLHDFLALEMKRQESK